jgi:DNA-binding transcriptional ArsR family regulator
MVMDVEVFQVLADPIRLHIVGVLKDGERAVNDIVETVRIDQSGVSRHLRILHEAGFVGVRPDGPRRLYSLRPERFKELDLWIQEYRAIWDARLDRFGEALVQARKRRSARRSGRPK